MPELPDIEVYRRELATHGLQREIAEVDLRDAGRLRGTSKADLEAALTDYAFVAARRHGKVLFAKVNCGWWLVMHFGMTGFVSFYDVPGDAPAHAHLVLRFADGGRFAYDDMRKLGWLELTDDVGAYLRSQDIGPDALDVDGPALRALVESRRGALKPLLMDQSAIAGIGNVYSDEILFQAALAPQRKANGLDGEEVRHLHDAMQAVLETAVHCGANPERMPDDWLIRQRGADGTCPRCGAALETAKVGGRTAHWCPQCQR